MKYAAADYALALYESVTAEPKQAARLVEGLEKTLRSAKQRHLFPLIVQHLELLEDKALQRVSVIAEVPEILTEAQSASIVGALEKQLKGQTIRLLQKVDASLIGGIRLTIGDKVIDHSIKDKLNQLATKL